MSLKSGIEEAIKSVREPASDKNLLELGVIQDVTVTGDRVIVIMEVEEAVAQSFEPLRRELDTALHAVKGVSSASVVMTALHRPGNAKPHSHAPAPGQARPPTPSAISGVRHVVAIASGKGGVGKSTSSVNLAYALIRLGYRVGLVDCDIYGPSASLLLGQDQKPTFNDEDRIVPIESERLVSISMSNILPPDSAAVWRGPMVMKSVQQFLQGVVWDINGPLDILIADLPPGTGDVQLTLAETARMSGAVIVTTPQDLALIDARKAHDMFSKVNIPVLGFIENMSYFECPKCGERSEIFSHGGARNIAAARHLPFLGEIPLDIKIREASDAGQPLVLADPEGPLSQAYIQIARDLAKTLEL